MNRILVIGGTGTVGRQVLSRLVAGGAQVRALVRNPGAAQLPPQVEMVRGDLTLPDTLDACLEGIDTVFLVWTAPAAAVAPALERITKHARRIVYLSAPLKTAHPLFQQPNPLRAMFEQISSNQPVRSRNWRYLLCHGWYVHYRHPNRRVRGSFSPNAEPDRISDCHRDWGGCPRP